MAGIGFSLQRILRHDNLTRIFAAYSTAGIISSTPWIISILSILVLGVFLSLVDEHHQMVVNFQISITYMVAASLILSGFAQNSFSRYISDQLFLNKSAAVIPNFNGIALILSSISGLFSFFLICIFFPHQSIAYRFLFMGSIVTLSLLWVVVNLLTGLKDYILIAKAFFLSYSLIVIVGYLMRGFGLEGLMFGYLLGQLLLLFIFLGALYEEYPTNKVIDFHFLKRNNMYKTLMFSGLIFNAATWIDKFIFWYEPTTSRSIIGPLRGSVFYDAPIFIAYILVAPGMGVLLFLIETNFSEYYQRFNEAIREGKSLSYIQVMKEQMITHAYNVVYSIIKIQGVTIIIVFQIGENILKLFNISSIYNNLLFVDVIGTSLQVVCLAILNLLYYMDKRSYALYLTLCFFFLNLIFSSLSIYLGPFFYGFGFTSALIVSCTLGMYLLDKEFRNLEYKLIMLR